MKFTPRLRTKVVETPCVLSVNDPEHTTQGARSVEYAKALAPQLLQRLGTQSQGCVVTITTLKGQWMGSYSQKGWTLP